MNPPLGVGPAEVRSGWIDPGFVVGLWLAAAIFLWPAISGHQAFYFRDSLCYYYPEAVLTSEAWKQGEIPLWDPRVSLGYPYQADPHSLVFYPLTILLVVLPLPLGYGLFTAAHVALAGSFLYLLLRRWRCAVLAAGLGAAVLMFGGYTVCALSLTTLLRGLTWTPLAMLAFDGFLATGRGRHLLAAALVLAVEGSGTDPNYVLFTAGFMALCPWLRRGAAAISWKRAWAGLLASGGVAILLLAVQYLPLAELVSRSHRMRVDLTELTLYDVHPFNLYNLAWPTPFPDPASPYFFVSFHHGELPFYPDLYWGFPVICLALAGLGWLSLPAPRPRSENDGSPTESPEDPEASPAPEEARTGTSALILVAAILGGLLLSLGKHLPMFEMLVTLVPPLRAFRFPAKYFFVAAMAMPILAALGFDGIIKGVARCARFALWSLGGAVAATLGLAIAFVRSGDRLPRMFLRDRGEGLTGDLMLFFDMIRNTWLANLGLALGLAAAAWLLIFLAARDKLPRAVALALLASLAVGDLAYTTRRAVPMGEPSLATAPSVTAGVVRSATAGLPPARYITYPPNEMTFGPDWTTLDYVRLESELLVALKGPQHGLPSFRSLLSVRTAAEDNISWLITQGDRASRDRFSAAMNTAVAVSPEGLGNVPGEGEVLCEAGPVVTRRLEGVSPRVFIPARATPASQGATLPTSEAIVCMPGEAVFVPEAESREAMIPTTVRACKVAEYGRNGLTVDFDLEGKGLLVVLDAYYPGWEATVDGERRPILKVAGLVRGVPVKGGERRMVMTYRPLPFRLGAVISLLTLLAVVLGLVGSRRRPTGAIASLS